LALLEPKAMVGGGSGFAVRVTGSRLSDHAEEGVTAARVHPVVENRSRVHQSAAIVSLSRRPLGAEVGRRVARVSTRKPGNEDYYPERHWSMMGSVGRASDQYRMSNRHLAPTAVEKVSLSVDSMGMGYYYQTKVECRAREGRQTEVSAAARLDPGKGEDGRGGPRLCMQKQGFEVGAVVGDGS